MSDVYSHGILLMETLTVRNSSDEMFGGEIEPKEMDKGFAPK